MYLRDSVCGRRPRGRNQASVSHAPLLHSRSRKKSVSADWNSRSSARTQYSARNCVHISSRGGEWSKALTLALTLESRRENIRAAEEGQVSAPLAALLHAQAEQDRQADQDFDQDLLASSIWLKVRCGQRAAAAADVTADTSPPVLPSFPLLQARGAIPPPTPAYSGGKGNAALVGIQSSPLRQQRIGLKVQLCAHREGRPRTLCA